MRPEPWRGDIETSRNCGNANGSPARPPKSQCLMSHPVSMSRCLNVSPGLLSQVSGLPLASANGTPLDRPRPARSRLAVRAPCAHQCQGNAPHMAKRFQKRAGHRPGPRKLRVSRNSFPPRQRRAKRALCNGEARYKTHTKHIQFLENHLTVCGVSPVKGIW